MYKFYFRACLFVTILIFPYVVYAAGLGKLMLNSALGQPLKAEIDLVAVRNDELSSLTANLASQEAFRQAGISYKPFFSTLEIAIDNRANGDSYIRISSPTAINEPFLNMLVELNWSSGRLMREYTVLLDPVESISPDELVAPTISDAPVVVETYPDKPEVLATPVIEQMPVEPVAILESIAEDTYGPVSQGDTLSKIARQVSPRDANLDQMMIALFRANKDAFIGNNINLLKVGEVLRIPTSSEIAEISKKDATAEVKVHVANWRNYKSELAEASNEAATAETLKQVDTGEIITSVADEIVALDARSDEVLRLSGGVHMHDKQGSGDAGYGSSQDRMRMMEEDSIARSLALIEANERIELLEKNIRNLQKLLELKDPALAQAQIKAKELIQEESAADLVPDSIDDILPSLEGIIDFAEQELDELFSSDAAIDSSIAALDISGIPSEIPAETPEATSSIMDQIMDNIAYIGGLLTFILLSVLVAMKIRRKKAENEADSDEQDFDASSTLRNRVASVAATDLLVSQEGADASQANEDISTLQADIEASFDVPEADQTKQESDEIDLDFSQDENADEDIVATEAMPENDTSYISDDLSEELLEPEPDNNIDLDLDNLGQNNEQDESSNLLNEPKEDGVVVEDLLADEAVDATEADNELAFTDEAIASLEEAIKSERQASAPVAETEINETESQKNEIDFDFNLDSENLTDNEASSELVDKGEGDTNSSEADNSISFDFDLPTETLEEDVPTEPVTPEETEPQNQDEKLDLSIDFPEAVDDTAVEPETAVDSNDSQAAVDASSSAATDAHDEHWYDIETKIDLAKAYIEMDDSEGAKEILEEVVQEGDAGQQEKANVMLGTLP